MYPNPATTKLTEAISVLNYNFTERNPAYHELIEKEKRFENNVHILYILYKTFKKRLQGSNEENKNEALSKSSCKQRVQPLNQAVI